jgi:hypothetical protein
MSLSKREFLTFGVAGTAAAALPAWAQPKALFETINMFVPAAPGGGWDGTARAIEPRPLASWARCNLKTSVVLAGWWDFHAS